MEVRINWKGIIELISKYKWKSVKYYKYQKNIKIKSKKKHNTEIIIESEHGSDKN